VMIRPRITMRRILDAGRDRMIIPLVLLATVSAVLGDVDRPAIDTLRKAPVPVHYSILVIGIVLAAFLFFLLFFYLFSWIAYGLSRVLEGSASPREVRSAMAWGLTPIIWAIVYRLPAILLWPETMESRIRRTSDAMTFQPGILGVGCIGGVVFATLELAMLVWYLVVTSNTLGEANRFSSWRGFGLLVLTSITPIVIVIAALLAS
jgi:hypothetical protein